MRPGTQGRLNILDLSYSVNLICWGRETMIRNFSSGQKFKAM